MAAGIVTSDIRLSVSDAVDALKADLEKRGVELFAVIDHAAGARKVGLELDDEVVVIFGNPTVGTRVMQDAPAVGLDLPLRILIWRANGQTHTAYHNPRDLAQQYALSTSTAALDGMATLLSALVAGLQ